MGFTINPRITRASIANETTPKVTDTVFAKMYKTSITCLSLIKTRGCRKLMYATAR